jgi:hypothetical protein
MGSVCYLQDMFTVEAARGRGVGRAYWNTSETNAAARSLYDKVATLTTFVQYRKDF